MHYDDLIYKTGGFGTYQKCILAFCFVVAMPLSIQTYSLVFLSDTTDFRCAVPDVQNDSYKISSVSHAYLVNQTIPFNDKTGQYSECDVYARSEDNETSSLYTNRTSPCRRWVYSKEKYSSTIVTQLDLVCDRKIYVAHGKMFVFSGKLVGAFFSGIFSDMFGRKKAVVVGLFFSAITSITFTFLPNIELQVVFRLIILAFSHLFYYPCYLLVTEVIAPSHRSKAMAGSCIGWSFGIFALVFVASLFRDWKTVNLVLSVPTFGLFIISCFLNESPRWLLQKGRKEEAYRILEAIAKMNKKELPPLDTLDLTVSKQKRESVFKIFKSKRLMWRLSILFINWCSCSMVYYGISMNVGSLIPGSLHWNFAIVGVIEMVAYSLATVGVDKMGRKPVFMGSMILGGLFCLLIIIPYKLNSDTVVTRVLSQFGYFGITVGFATIFQLTGELFPTAVRSSVVSLCNISARLGGMVSPYVAMYLMKTDLGSALPLIIFGCVAISSGLLAFLVPETANRKLPDTILEAKALGRKKDKNRPDMDGEEKVALSQITPDIQS